MKGKLIFLLPLFLIFFGCSSDNDANPPEKEVLKSITNEVLFFEFTPDTGNNSSRLRYNIKYTNPNKVAIKGVSTLTMNYDGIILTPIKKVPPYIEIAANSSFTESYDVETAFNLSLGKTKSIKLVSVEFTIVD